MATIYKRGRTWYLDLRVNGKRIRRKVGSSKKIAELALKDAEVKIARDEFGFTKNDIGNRKFFDRFLEYSKAIHQITTTNRYRAVIDHFITFLNEKRHALGFLSQITPEVIDQYKVHRKTVWINPNGSQVETKEGIKGHTRKGARAHTINFEIGTLRTIFYLAMKWGYLKENPTKLVKRLKVDDSKKIRLLSIEECRQLLEACPQELYPIYFTFLNSGLRKAELENLEWDDIEFDRRKIKVQRKTFWKPKTGEREVPINSPLMSLFKDLHLKNEQGLQSNFVFPHNDGSKIKTKLRERLIRIAEQAGIKRLSRVHDLRHTFASHLVMKGVDLPTVKELLGHSNIETTMIYAHLSPDHLSDSVDKLDFG